VVAAAAETATAGASSVAAKGRLGGMLLTTVCLSSTQLCLMAGSRSIRQHAQLIAGSCSITAHHSQASRTSNPQRQRAVGSAAVFERQSAAKCGRKTAAARLRSVETYN
jgi:hypothetical protein